MPEQLAEARELQPLKLDIQDIKRLLPHRYPMLLVDRVTHLEPGAYAEGHKCVTANEPFLMGHFPEFPIMPGVLIVDALAQLTGIMMRSRAVDHPVPVETAGDQAPSRPGVLASIPKMRFLRPVFPGDQLVLRSTHVKTFGPTHRVDVEALVDGEPVAKGHLVVAS